MELCIIRHTKVDVPKGLCYGVSDVPLANSFEAERDQVSEALNGINYDLIFSSPSKRCLMLAQHIGPSVTADDRLKELNFGDWELKNWDHINNEYAQKWMADYLNVPCPGGESFADLLSRFEFFMSDLKSMNRNAIIISHGGIIRAAYHILLGIPVKELFNLTVDFGSIHKFNV